MDPRIIRTKLKIVRDRSVSRRQPVSDWEMRSADHVAAGEYRFDGGWKSLADEGWWPAGKTVFLRTRVKPPKDFSAESLYLIFDIERLEGLLSVNGRPYAGVDANHRRVKAPHGETLELELEFVSVPEVVFMPEMKSERSRLREARFEQVDRDIEASWYDLQFAWEAAQAAREDRRKQLLLDALEEALLAVDLTLPEDRFRKELAAAREILAERVRQIAPDPEGGRMFLTGHSHIDTAWLWPVRETIRKCARTFSTMCRLMERYPEFRFTCSQPQLYAYTKEHYPDLYDEVKRRVKEGRWETTGGMWVEADCNIPSGESLIRQVLHGVRFFREEFGTRPRTCWLPDVFGYPGNLPQIVRGCGLHYFYTNKLHWQARNPFPYHLFKWEGIDGTQALAHIPLLTSYYCGTSTPAELVAAWENFKEKSVHGELMYPFGYGDGGGGPTEGALEYAERAKSYPGVPSCRQGLEEQYFQSVQDAAPDLPTWRGELYLETHRGTFTSQAATKRANRKNELLLREAEIAGTVANQLGAGIDLDALRTAWEGLLLLQFHDILPGSSIAEVYDEASQDYEVIRKAASSVRDTALGALADGVPPADLMVFNSLSWARNDVITATIESPGGFVEFADSAGRAAPIQVVGKQGGQAEIVFAPADVPALGYTTLKMRPSEREHETSLEVSDSRTENRFYVVELNEIGEITSLYDKRHDREVVAQGQTANQLQLFQDGPEPEAAWNVHDTFEKRRYEFEGKITVDAIESGPVRGVIRVVRNHRESRIEQDIVIYDSLPRIDFITRGEWHERQVMLKAAFPVEVMADNATYEIQFGAIQRPTHDNTSWDQEKFEVPAQRWADISEAGYGVSLLNDCKYGYDVKGSVLRLTLLRGPEWPDPEADKGSFEFTYSLLPHSGDWREGETVRRAMELNVPMMCRPCGKGSGQLPGTGSFLIVNGPAVLETLKPADDGNGVIVRLYEPHGGRGKVTVTVPDGLREVTACNLVEENDGRQPIEGDRFSFEIRPFQIRTFRMMLSSPAGSR